MNVPLECRDDDGQRVYSVRRGSEVVGHIVIDSAVGGRSRGGLRLVEDLCEGELRAAARAMTLKFGFLGLPQGGAKAGVAGDGEAPVEERRRQLGDFARAVQPLLSRREYVPDADIGTRAEDIRWMLQSVGVRVKQREWRGSRSGYFTAVSCLASAEAALGQTRQTLADCRVAIEGFGSVGASLAGLLARRGATVVAVSTSRGAVYNPRGLDVDVLLRVSQTAGSRVVEQYDDAERLDRAALLELPVDLLCPCARYQSIHEGNAPRVATPLICGGANNPISPEAERMLVDRGVLCVPDFVANCGGVLGGTMEFASVAGARIEAMIEDHIGRRVSWLLEDARRKGVPPREVAEAMAIERFEQVRAAASNPTLMSRLFAVGLECHRRGWVPRRFAAVMAPRYFERLLDRAARSTNG